MGPKAADTDDLSPAVSPGWHFDDRGVTYNGKPVPVAGRNRALLRVLAAATAPLKCAELRKAWEDYEIEEDSIRWQIGQLRKILRDVFEFEGDPIPAKGSGYFLQIR